MERFCPWQDVKHVFMWFILLEIVCHLERKRVVYVLEELYSLMPTEFVKCWCPQLPFTRLCAVSVHGCQFSN